MIALPNGCRCSSLTVFPKNWNTAKASIKKDWYISYRFYDPTFPKPKQRMMRGMNEFKTVPERQAATLAILKDEMDLLKNRGFNPITGFLEDPIELAEGDIYPSMPLTDALEAAFAKIDVSKDCRAEVKRTLGVFKKSAILLRKDQKPIDEIKRKDIRLILNACEKIKLSQKLTWSNNQFNVYRAHISMLFSYLNREEILENNPVDKIDKKQTIKQVRDILTDNQRRTIDQYLQNTHPNLRRFVHIFFHSGARRNEIMRVQGCHVDLERQRFKLLVKKRRQMAWVWKTIKDIALPFWIDAMAGCGPDDFVFSIGLKPGPAQINPKQITRSWKYHVKEKLKIDIDFYSLKHLHTTEIVDILEDGPGKIDPISEIAEHNSHTNGAMVVQIYDVKNKDRQGKKVKGIRNSFA